jgi:hypothetical protein
MERMKVEQERKKTIFTQEALKEKVLNCVGLCVAKLLWVTVDCSVAWLS